MAIPVVTELPSTQPDEPSFWESSITDPTRGSRGSGPRGTGSRFPRSSRWSTSVNRIDRIRAVACTLAGAAARIAPTKARLPPLTYRFPVIGSIDPRSESRP